MPLKNFTHDDIANILLSEENKSEDYLWSDDEGNKVEYKEIIESEHEDDSNYGAGAEEAYDISNAHDDRDVTNSVKNGIIIIGRNCYELSVNQPKGMGRPPKRNIGVVQPANKGEARNCKHEICFLRIRHTSIYIYIRVSCRKFCFTQIKKWPGEQIYIYMCVLRKRHIAARQKCVN
jgi:hypothetical protein